MFFIIPYYVFINTLFKVWEGNYGVLGTFLMVQWLNECEKGYRNDTKFNTEQTKNTESTERRKLSFSKE